MRPWKTGQPRVWRNLWGLWGWVGADDESLPLYSCYYVTIHFASAEAASDWIAQELPNISNSGVWDDMRLQRGGEQLRMCMP